MRCCREIAFSEFSLLEIEMRISEISDQRSGGKEKTENAMRRKISPC
jgi:hypothetical protein